MPQSKSEKQRAAVSANHTSRRRNAGASRATGSGPRPGQGATAPATEEASLNLTNSSTGSASGKTRATSMPEVRFDKHTAHLFMCLKASQFVESLENYREFAQLVCYFYFLFYFFLNGYLYRFCEYLLNAFCFDRAGLIFRLSTLECLSMLCFITNV